ncbi:hypothetical protein B0T26DRAFT_670196 [Lasiosphaeria miniovina]|uniref:Uncharacterized protein n=1 Tax=Lasiosphaeria miniovina TaxID=1954250 RepID=A0AA40E9Y8_9PEZI|nr:uncharacterized protein B0T26DRAFT_670196 [Lasiosphaeria miniovina]KAK0733834.1 hypothetical protein B0T26DRAFT_670196 [Lasiosphaeria miniovina]
MDPINTQNTSTNHISDHDIFGANSGEVFFSVPWDVDEGGAPYPQIVDLQSSPFSTLDPPENEYQLVVDFSVALRAPLAETEPLPHYDASISNISSSNSSGNNSVQDEPPAHGSSARRASRQPARALVNGSCRTEHAGNSANHQSPDTDSSVSGSLYMNVPSPSSVTRRRR